MTIQFSNQEIQEMRSYLDKVQGVQSREQLDELPQEFPEMNLTFLLLRKLLAYGVHGALKADQGMSYQELQTKSQKPKDMLVAVHAQAGQFNRLLAAYTARYYGIKLI